MTPRTAEADEQEVLISIGGLVGRFTLGAAPAPFLAQLHERYAPYEIPPAPWVECAFEVRMSFLPAAPIRDPEERAGEVASRPLRVEERENLIRLRRWDFQGELRARARGRGASVNALAWTGELECQMNPFAFDSLLRVLWATFLPRAGGALFHACALRFDDAGVIFPGESGAGKSTLARKVQEPDHVLTDELVAVSRGELGRWRISGTPFWGEFKRGGGSIRSWPLQALAFLHQAPDVAATPIPASEAAMRLLACFLCFQSDADTAARNLAIAINLSSEIPAVALRTARETPIGEIAGVLAAHIPERQHRDHPASTREMISEFRWFLRENQQYAFKPRGTSMRPWLRPGDALFIQRLDGVEAAPGDVLLYWTPGRTPEEDQLTCHRLVARTRAGASGSEKKFKYYMKGDARSSIERFVDGRQSEILGRVSAISRDGRTVPVPGRVGSLARLVGSLVAAPLLRLTGR